MIDVIVVFFSNWLISCIFWWFNLLVTKLFLSVLFLLGRKAHWARWTQNYFCYTDLTLLPLDLWFRVFSFTGWFHHSHARHQRSFCYLVSSSFFFFFSLALTLLLLHGVCSGLRFLARSRFFANQAEILSADKVGKSGSDLATLESVKSRSEVFFWKMV